MRNVSKEMGKQSDKYLLHTNVVILTLLLSLNVLCSNSFAYCVNKDQTDKEIKWRYARATFKINTTGGPSSSLSAIKEAMQTWTNVKTSCFAFVDSGTTTSTAYGINDGQNIISFGYLDDSDTLAQNTFWYDPSTGRLLDSDIRFNTGYGITWSCDCSSYSTYDVQDIGTHELGHSLSLCDLYDSYDSEKTMYGYGITGEFKKISLDQDDIDGIAYLYPCGADNCINSCLNCEITVISPKVGESWGTGTTQTIIWDTGYGIGTDVKIELYKGECPFRTIVSSTSNNGSYSWSIDSSLPDSSNYRIKITSTAHLTCNDYSSNFSLNKPDLYDRGEIYRSFSPQTICGGDSLEVNTDIMNGGGVASGTFKVKFYVSSDTNIDLSDFYIGEQNMPTISAGQGADCDWYGIFPSEIPAGTYYVGWIIDAENDVKEKDESNNKAYKTGYQLTVASSPHRPGSIDYPSSDCDGSFTVSWSPISGTNDYTLQRATNSSFTDAITVYTGPETSWNQAGLTDGIYYYRVRDSSSGDICGWRNGPAMVIGVPATPGNPSPSVGEAGVSPDTKLDWDDTPGAIAYDVYFGTSSPPSSVGNVHVSNYDPGTMDSYTTYYWKIVAKNDCGETPSEGEWNFTTDDLESCLIVPDNYPTIQGAIGAASDGCVIIVRDGTYTENIDFMGKAITIRSRNGPDKTIIDGGGNGSVVVFRSGEGLGSILEGFSLINGSGTDQWGDDILHGGGVFADKNASFSLNNCVITQNTTLYYGGGIYTEGGAAVITNCTISNNQSTDAYGAGGGVFFFASPAILANCLISDNTAAYGGGIYSYLSNPSIDACRVTGNSASEDGGGICCDNTSPVISNSLISGNKSSGLDNGGGAIYLGSSSPVMINSTVVGNLTSGIGGGIHSKTDSALTIVNSIFWGNMAGATFNEVYFDQSSSIDTTYSDIQGGNPDNPGQPYPGTGNIVADPLFIDLRPATEAPTSNGDYHLLTNSPCIDSGTNLQAPSNDIDNDPRPWDGDGDENAECDMGFDEYACTPGETQSCDTGLDGICQIGTRRCSAAEHWSGCLQDNQPAPEICDGKDNDCNGAIDDSEDCTIISIDLNEGWNLISLYRQPTDTAITGVLAPVSDNCNSVWEFNGGWRAYYPAFPGYSDLDTMEAGWGYWLNMNVPTTLTFNGVAPTKTISLTAGWNLVGYNSAESSMPIADAIQSISESCESVWAYINGEWKAYYPAYPDYSDLEVMEPNYGYWIKTTQACDWTLP